VNVQIFFLSHQSQDLRAAFACREWLEYIAFDELSHMLYGVDDEDYIYRYDLKGKV